MRRFFLLLAIVLFCGTAFADVPRAVPEPELNEYGEPADEPPVNAPPGLFGRGTGRLLGMAGTLALVLLVGSMFASTSGTRSAGWGSYYLFWFVMPTLLAAVSAHPVVLV